MCVLWLSNYHIAISLYIINPLLQMCLKTLSLSSVYPMSACWHFTVCTANKQSQVNLEAEIISTRSAYQFHLWNEIAIASKSDKASGSCSFPHAQQRIQHCSFSLAGSIGGWNSTPSPLVVSIITSKWSSVVLCPFRNLPFFNFAEKGKIHATMTASCLAVSGLTVHAVSFIGDTDESNPRGLQGSVSYKMLSKCCCFD